MPRLPIRLAFSLFALLPLPALADELTTFTLDNGMEVVVLEDHRAPVVVQMVWYRVGAADEPPGKSGIAHYLEHLMFKGTDTLEPGEFSKVVAANGGTDNAFTSQDYTAYHQRVAANRLDLVMQMEADRMRDLQLDGRDILTERQVVIEERAQRTDSDPGALFNEQRNAAQYQNHPYGIPVIGWKHEMEALTLDDALSFYRRYYAPNNAVLVVAGDVDPAEVRRLAETHYGALAPTPDLPERLRPQEPPQRAERRMLFKDARIAQPYVIRTYLAPERDPGDQTEAAALTLLAAVLGGSSQTSELGRALQFDNPKALYTSAFYDGINLDDTTFGLVIVPVPGVSLQQAEDLMDAEIAAFLDRGVDPEQLERIRMQLNASLIYGQDSVQARAQLYGSALTSGLTLEDVKVWPELLQQVTGEDIVAAGRRVFQRDNAVTGWLRAPEGAVGTVPDPAAETALETSPPTIIETNEKEVTQ
ncbi:pitrilysin family protein [Oceaniovalibus sp. ACAM 378]|uniref:M16 family metallopeptidase n=1 Tax=Oceaniovalibus sp. ACAM 378 TaxID=2599923 RepID=UPI0011D64F86|nr:pitrilysin family protein [Oceaniovalibus sp. ACAM 378]TYB86341.1 insulinase family protein [Oceaniovalibus sp. ACAM 378]